MPLHKMVKPRTPERERSEVTRFCPAIAATGQLTQFDCWPTSHKPLAIGWLHSIPPARHLRSVAHAWLGRMGAAEVVLVMPRRPVQKQQPHRHDRMIEQHSMRDAPWRSIHETRNARSRTRGPAHRATCGICRTGQAADAVSFVGGAARPPNVGFTRRRD